MTCPHCAKAIHFEESGSDAYPYHEEGADITGFDVAHGFCPACGGFIVLFREGILSDQRPGEDYLTGIRSSEVLYPRQAASRAVPPEVPPEYGQMFKEAAAVLSVSPKASAALSRRLLQSILEDRYEIHEPSLAAAIERFLKLGHIPTHLREEVDAVRNIGNLAAHPIKDTSTGQVVDVEPGEAEWLVEVLDSLFDFTFVQPERAQQRRERLNEKLAAAGKPPMKEPQDT